MDDLLASKLPASAIRVNQLLLDHGSAAHIIYPWSSFLRHLILREAPFFLLHYNEFFSLALSQEQVDRLCLHLERVVFFEDNCASSSYDGTGQGDTPQQGPPMHPEINCAESECCICMDRSIDQVLPCAHGFCQFCWGEWSSTHSGCPICRQQVISPDDTYILTKKDDDSRTLSFSLSTDPPPTSSLSMQCQQQIRLRNKVDLALRSWLVSHDPRRATQPEHRPRSIAAPAEVES